MIAGQFAAARDGYQRALDLLDADPDIDAAEKSERRAHALGRLARLRRLGPPR